MNKVDIYTFSEKKIKGLFEILSKYHICYFIDHN